MKSPARDLALTFVTAHLNDDLETADPVVEGIIDEGVAYLDVVAALVNLVVEVAEEGARRSDATATEILQTVAAAWASDDE